MPKEIRNKRIIWILVLSLFIMAAGITADAFWFASSRFRVHYETLSSNTIPQNMDGMSIAAFGDLEYGTFMNEERLSRVVRKLNELSPDTIIFLGDLYDTGYLPDEASEKKLVDLLSSMQAAKGKFAVLGDYDNESEDKRNQVIADLTQAGFEILDNEIIRLHNGTSASIDLVGLSDTITGIGDLNTLYSDISPDSFTLAVCHTPDIARSLPLGATDVLLSANAHASQIRIPVYGAIDSAAGSKYFSAGQHYYNSMTIYDSYGLGTTKTDVRLFSNPEVLFFRLTSH